MDTRPRELSLFSGAGGGLLGTKLLGWRAVCYVEWDKYCQRVLQARIADGYLDDAPIWDDVRTFDGSAWRGCVDVITAGFPCQPFSVAGQRKGAADERNLWPDTIRIIREVGPEVVLLENVPGLFAHQYFGTILGDLAESGFDVQWRCLSAAEVGASHIRARLWFLAYTNSTRGGRSAGNTDHQTRATSTEGRASVPLTARRSAGFAISDTRTTSEDVPNSVNERPGRREQQPEGGEGSRNVPNHDSPRQPATQGQCAATGTHGRRVVGSNNWWDSEPPLGRVVNGLADRVGQLRALGNGQVPAVVARVWELLTAADNRNRE